MSDFNSLIILLFQIRHDVLKDNHTETTKGV